MTMQKYYFEFYGLSFSCVYHLFVCVIKGYTHPDCDSSVFLFWSFLCLFLLLCVTCSARFVSTLWISRGNLLLRKVNNIKNSNTQINKYQAHLSEKNMKLPNQFKNPSQAQKNLSPADYLEEAAQWNWSPWGSVLPWDCLTGLTLNVRTSVSWSFFSSWVEEVRVDFMV